MSSHTVVLNGLEDTRNSDQVTSMQHRPDIDIPSDEAQGVTNPSSTEGLLVVF